MRKPKKNVVQKEFIMEIRKSRGRFLSIFFIVALGVSLFVGISATQPDMILSGDRYNDENKLMDFKVVSTYGLTKEDLGAIQSLPAIESAVGSYSTDVLCEVEENMKVLHLMSHTEEMNLVTVTEGRMPKKATECLMDEDFLKTYGYQIGDKISLVSGTEDPLTDQLYHTEFEIVGSGNSPLYYSFNRGSSTIGNGSVNGFLIVEPEAFAMEVYTEIYGMVEGAKDVRSFTEEYEEMVDDALEQIELIQNGRCEVRKSNLAQEAQILIEDARKELEQKRKEAEKQIEENDEKLDAAQLELTIGKLQLETGKIGLESGRAQIENSKAQLESGRAQIESGKAELEAGKKELEQSKALYEEIMTPLKEEKEKLEQQLEEWEGKLGDLDETSQAVAQEAIQTIRNTLKSVEEKIVSVTKEYEEEIKAGEAQIAETEALLKEKEAELFEAEKMIAEAEKELAASEKQMQDSSAQIKDGEQEIKDGKQELEAAKKEMEEQLADGAAKIDEAEKEIDQIDLPVWYVFDRSAIPEYSGFGDNAARIAALSIVFPSIFFLVATLISLTTMTRMVEEQRVQIGTMKALGYSNLAIMKKYINYALLATVGGSIFGVLLGEKIFPYVIISSYYMTVYTHLSYILIPYELWYGIAATAVAALCTGGATVLACYKELFAQPAVLMRPEAPKVGKRTWIERVPFLWSHLNFSWKSTMRNLFRYKKRFFMTLFGIGGCMGLLMVGYGLRDSITSISDHQYGELQLYDNSVFLSDSMKEETRTQLDTYLEENGNVKSYMDVKMVSMAAERGDEKVDTYLTVIGDTKKAEDFFVFRNRRTKKSYALSEDGVILTEKTASLLGVSTGDQILLSEDGKKEKKVTITAICENYAGHYVYMTKALYEKLYDEEPFSNTILIKAKDTVSEKEMEQMGEGILAFDHVLNVQYTANLKGQLESMLVALDKVMIVLIIVAGMLSFVVLYNLNNINITERRRELATLKVLGFYDMEVANYVYRENILLTLLGVIVGCFVGKFLHYFTIVTVEVDMAMFGREISLFSYGICALFTIGFSAFVNWMMYFKLKKIDMVESLKSVE